MKTKLLRAEAIWYAPPEPLSCGMMSSLATYECLRACWGKKVKPPNPARPPRRKFREGLHHLPGPLGDRTLSLLGTVFIPPFEQGIAIGMPHNLIPMTQDIQRLTACIYGALEPGALQPCTCRQCRCRNAAMRAAAGRPLVPRAVGARYHDSLTSSRPRGRPVIDQ